MKSTYSAKAFALHGLRLAMLVMSAAVSFGALTAADAQPDQHKLPTYDVEYLCKWQVEYIAADLKRPSYIECFETQQSAYEKLKSVWPKLSQEQKTLCSDVATMRVGSKEPAPPSYFLLLACAETQRTMQNEMQSLPNLKFKY